MTAPPVRALLTAGALTGEWVLDPRKSSIRLKSVMSSRCFRHSLLRMSPGDCTNCLPSDVSIT